MSETGEIMSETGEIMSETGEIMSETPAQTETKRWCYKMKDLCKITGLSRQAIHFYIQQGLIPAGQKTGHNMAWYTEEHVEKIRTIRTLQHERFLPLKAIKAILDEQDALYSPAQRDFLRELRCSIEWEGISINSSPAESVCAEKLIEAGVISETDLEELINAQIIGVRVDKQGALHVSQKDIEILKLLSELRRAGFTKELGFHVDLIRKYEKSIIDLVHWEGQLVVEKLGTLPPHQAAAVIQDALPIVHKLLIHYHQLRITDLLTSL